MFLYCMEGFYSIVAPYRIKALSPYQWYRPDVSDILDLTRRIPDVPNTAKGRSCS